MPPSEIRNIGVIGAGQMGAGIAQVAAQRGFTTILVDVDSKQLDKGKTYIAANLARGVEKQKWDKAHVDDVLGRLRYSLANKDLKDCDLVIEAIVENRDIKRKVFAELDGLVKKHAILATNTSSLPITDLAAATKRADRFIGMHFMNPVPVMKLVEVIRGHDTSDDTTRAVKAVAETMGKVPVEVRDFPGFVSNRVLLPFINEAIFALHEGVGTKEAIDTVFKLGMSHPMGPLELADFVGLDTCLAILDVLYDGFKDPKYRACPLLRQKVQAGHLGKKTGKGFYEYG